MLRQERNGHHSFGRKQNFISCCDIQCQNLTREYTTTMTTTTTTTTTDTTECIKSLLAHLLSVQRSKLNGARSGNLIKEDTTWVLPKRELYS